MKDKTLESVAKLYTDSLNEYGAESKGVGWGDDNSHRLRFDKLIAVIDRNADVTVNDLGCGYGAFYTHLLMQGIKVCSFRGYEISAAMLKEAQHLIGGQNVELTEGALLDKCADYSFACGIFNVRMNSTEHEWFGHIVRTLDNMNEYSTKGFAFNMLTSYVDWKEPHLYYGDPAVFFDYCKQRYSRYVSLLHDYPLWEWTICVRKQ